MAASAAKTTTLTVLPVGFARKRTLANALVRPHIARVRTQGCSSFFEFIFQQEIASGNSLLNAIQLIGCFSTCPDHAFVEANIIQPPAQGNLLKGIDNKTVGR